MPTKYSSSEIAEVKSKIDMIEYLEKNGVAMRQAGANSFKGLCPLHNENSPSFNVRVGTTQSFRCFGCDTHGDIIDLIEKWDNLTFQGAIEKAADYAGIELKGTGEEDPEYQRKQRLYRMNKIASEFYHRTFMALPDDHPAKVNLADRNLLYPNNVEGYGGLTDETIGYASGKGLLDELYGAGFAFDELRAGGLATEHPEYGRGEFFRNRLMWTITDVQGRPIAFSGRKLDQGSGGKYINTIETPLYKKSAALLGFSEARDAIREKHAAIVVEGNADVMAFRAVGVYNAVAACGTAFGEGHARLLNLLAASSKNANRFEFIFCFDSDAPGVKAARSVFTNIRSIALNSFVVSLGEKDPCDTRLTEGDDALRNALANKVSLIEFILRQELKAWDISQANDRQNFMRQAREVITEVVDPVQRDFYTHRIASWTGISVVEVARYVLSGQIVRGDAGQEKSLSTLPNIQTRLLAAAVQYPEVFEKIANVYNLNAFMFLDHEELAQKVLRQVDLDEIDHRDTEVSALLHGELKIGANREYEAIRTLLTSFLRTMYTIEQGRVTTDLAQAGEASNFMLLLQKQQELKKRYHQ